MSSFKKKKFQKKNGFNQNSSNNFAPAQFNIPQSYDLLISNYPKDRSPDAILGVLNTLVFSNFGGYPNFSNQSQHSDGFKVSVLNNIQFDALLQLNGAFVYNYPIWITKFPSNSSLINQSLKFSYIFQTYSTEGLIDLSDFATKLMSNEGDPSIVNFNNREFVEFFLHQLGTDSRDKQFWVSSLILCNNGIKSIAPWASFVHFLPNLKYININNNPIEFLDDIVLPDYLQISVDFNGKLRPRNNNSGNNNNNSFQPPQNQNNNNNKKKFNSFPKTNNEWDDSGSNFNNDFPPENSYPPIQDATSFPTVDVSYED